VFIETARIWWTTAERVIPECGRIKPSEELTDKYLTNISMDLGTFIFVTKQFKEMCIKQRKITGLEMALLENNSF
jgi:hypothetical protein